MQYLDFYHFSAPLRNNALIARFSAMLGIYTDKALREFAVNYPAKTAQESPETYVEAYTDALFRHTLLGKIPLFTAARHYLTGVLRDYTNIFNQTYLAKIQNINDENILILDIAGFLTDIFNNPAEFGIDNIVGVACGNGTLAAQKRGLCNSNSPDYDSSRIYAFADIIHPAAEIHRAFANYVLAALSAPVQFSSLAGATFNTLKQIRQTLNRNQQELLTAPPNAETYTAVAELNLNRDQTINQQGSADKKYLNALLNLGFNYQTTAANSWGALVSLNIGNSRHTDNFSYRAPGYYLSLWDLYRLSPVWWSSVSLGWGHTDLKKIRRSIPIIKGKLSGTGNTAAASGYISWQSGYQLPLSAALNHSAYVGITHEEIHLHGYAESNNPGENNSSAAMFFKSKKLRQDYITLGGRLNYKQDNRQFYLAWDLNRTLNKQNAEIYSGLKKFSRPFKRKVIITDKNWLSISGGIKQELSLKTTAYISLGGNYGHRSKGQYNINLGWRRQL